MGIALRCDSMLEPEPLPHGREGHSGSQEADPNVHTPHVRSVAPPEEGRERSSPDRELCARTHVGMCAIARLAAGECNH
jgi:hypothetical protein